jgi:hypothetical protein
MLRAFSMFSLAGVFLAISPRLRDQVYDGIGAGVSAMETHAPYSYIAGGILLLLTMVYSFYRGAQAR